jgi:hypothetical protein
MKHNYDIEKDECIAELFTHDFEGNEVYRARLMLHVIDKDAFVAYIAENYLGESCTKYTSDIPPHDAFEWLFKNKQYDACADLLPAFLNIIASGGTKRKTEDKHENH